MMKIIDPAKDNRRFGEKLVTVFAHEIKGIVVNRNHDIQWDFPVFLLVDLDQELKIVIVKEPLGIHEFHMKIDLAASALQACLDPLDVIIGPAQSFVVGVEDQDVALMGLLGKNNLSGKEKNQARQG
jgi:hypothetical protein